MHSTSMLSLQRPSSVSSSQTCQTCLVLYLPKIGGVCSKVNRASATSGIFFFEYKICSVKVPKHWTKLLVGRVLETVCVSTAGVCVENWKNAAGCPVGVFIFEMRECERPSGLTGLDRQLVVFFFFANVQNHRTRVWPTDPVVAVELEIVLCCGSVCVCVIYLTLDMHAIS